MIHGRADATLKSGGVRIGTAEIYRQVDALDEVLESLVIAQAWDGDVRIVLFALGLAIVTPLVFGVVPAFRAARGMSGDALKEGGRTLTSGRRKAWRSTMPP